MARVVFSPKLYCDLDLVALLVTRSQQNASHLFKRLLLFLERHADWSQPLNNLRAREVSLLRSCQQMVVLRTEV